MTNTRQIKILTVACAALAGAGVAATGGSAQESPTTIELTQRQREVRTGYVDAPPKRREGPGDIFTIAGPVRNTAGSRAGRADGAFAQTSAGRAHGTVTFRLPPGNLEVQGAIGPGRVSNLAIVGGTGAYARASGEVEVVQGRRGVRFRFTLAQ